MSGGDTGDRCEGGRGGRGAERAEEGELRVNLALEARNGNPQLSVIFRCVIRFTTMQHCHPTLPTHPTPFTFPALSPTHFLDSPLMILRPRSLRSTASTYSWRS